MKLTLSIVLCRTTVPNTVIDQGSSKSLKETVKSLATL